jgi:hypothetical protein
LPCWKNRKWNRPIKTATMSAITRKSAMLKIPITEWLELVHLLLDLVVQIMAMLKHLPIQ